MHTRDVGGGGGSARSRGVRGSAGGAPGAPAGAPLPRPQVPRGPRDCSTGPRERGRGWRGVRGAVVSTRRAPPGLESRPGTSTGGREEGGER